jgi:hypothetical protein
MAYGRTKVPVGVCPRDGMMSGLVRESAGLQAEMRIKYVDFQADPTHRIAERIMPVVNNGHAWTICLQPWYQAVLDTVVKH